MIKCIIAKKKNQNSDTSKQNQIKTKETTAQKFKQDTAQIGQQQKINLFPVFSSLGGTF